LGAGMMLFLCGDVMLGRGIDQIMAHPSDPSLYEPYVASALGYVGLAEDAHGAIPRGVAPDYVWGDLLADLDGADADLPGLTAFHDSSVPSGARATGTGWGSD
jgi:poly-gamma-glutamate capsule biosynthesis protein CapA/YwtB (metallophosphatase superfamily)